jgi:hypothetical protein
VRAFDKHRFYGSCRDITPLGYEKVNGVWREPMDHLRVQAFRDRVGR